MASFNLVHIFTLLSFINFVTSEAQFGNDFSGQNCSGSPTTPNSSFQSNVRTLLSYLSSNATANKPFYNTTVTGTTHSTTVYGMFFCSGDVTPQLCSECVANATNAIFSDPDSYPNCSLSSDAVIGNGDCMFRFSNRYFFSKVDLYPYFGPLNLCILDSEPKQKNFSSLFLKTSKEVVDEAAESPIGEKKYATREARVSGFQTLYCQAQCTPDLSPHDCTECLNSLMPPAAEDNICLPRSFYFSCSLRCEFYPFYRPSTAPAPPEPVLLPDSSNTDSQDPLYLSHNCSSSSNKTMITTDNVFLSNLRTLFTYLSSNSTTKPRFFNTTVDTVSGLFMCRGDLSPDLCRLCVLDATKRIASECRSSNEAIIWYNNCFLRYSNDPFPSTTETSPTYHRFNIKSTSDPNLHQRFFTWTLANALYDAQIDTGGPFKNYGTKEAKLNDHQSLYTLAECTPNIDVFSCRRCLDKIFNSEIPWCCLTSPVGKVFYPSCYMMFGLSPMNSTDHQTESKSTVTGNKKGWSRTLILIVVFVALSVILLSLCCYLRWRKTRKSSYKTLLAKIFGHESVTLKGLQFELNIIKTATNHFSQQNKIGKGGFGEVYKGVLPDGRQVAVKRLSRCSKQDNTQSDKLSWSERYKIIEGTALGILYLHDYSRLKIIHRDLKPSNVLLDENMNPKISDFGMAKIVDLDQDRGNTNKIVGTYGYMSPEYAMLGQFSEKSDVFSFGIMVLEIITGKRNVNVYKSQYEAQYESHTLMEGFMGYVWRQWKDERLLSILDSNIKEDFSEVEVLKCINIGLLCIQEDPNIRPTMSTVISYLNNHSELSSPQDPTFFMRNIHHHIIPQQGSSQDENGYKQSSINDMSVSNFYPR
ncbi:cysteine-rich receptor-like protein kinase 6 isoform X2 [Phaseolus vulgaris]|uniref:cysteine-rich receptor-like protein kinase 6 isoform X2 n=1 Tax=Phaseolus vulgaris TaxID=3885 RepID=UPI0035CBD503